MAQIYELQGLSTDTKPILADMASGSTFTELDTDSVYVYNSIQNNWLLQSTVVKVEATAVGIRDIRKTSTKDNVDTYTIYYTSGASTTFTVTNGSEVEAGTGLQKTDTVVGIDDKIVATWEKIVANQVGDPDHVLNTIFLDDTLYYVGDGVGVGLKKVELSEDNIFIFTLADDTQLTCAVGTMLDPLYERLANISEELNGQFEALDAKLAEHEANITAAMAGVEELEGKCEDNANDISDLSEVVSQVQADAEELGLDLQKEAEMRQTEDSKLVDLIDTKIDEALESYIVWTEIDE